MSMIIIIIGIQLLYFSIFIVLHDILFGYCEIKEYFRT